MDLVCLLLWNHIETDVIVQIFGDVHQFNGLLIPCRIRDWIRALKITTNQVPLILSLVLLHHMAKFKMIAVGDFHRTAPLR